MKKNKIIVLVILLILIIGGDIFLVSHFSSKPNNPENPNSTPTTPNDNPTTKKVICTKADTIVEDTMTYQLDKKYSFSVNQDNKLFDYLDETIYTFENIEDFNSFYQDLEITIANMKNKAASITKNEADLTIYFSLVERWGDSEYYKDGYVDFLEDSFGYSCEIQNA